MLEWQDSGIVLSVRRHGENGGIASILTQEHGRAAGYIYGINSSRKIGLTEVGNRVSVHWHAKTQDQLGMFELETEKSIAAHVMDEPQKLLALQSACILADKTLAENERHDGMYHATVALLVAFESDMWMPVYIYWEMGLLRELGFGLDLSQCVVTGSTENLFYVSPKSGGAVSEAAAGIYKDRLLKLPPFLRGVGEFSNEDLLDGLKLTGHFLASRVFALSNHDLPDVRLRLEQKYANNKQ